MFAGTSTSFSLIVCFLVCSSEAQEIIPAKKIPAELGKNVVLPSQVPNNINVNKITAVEWSRPEMDPEYVLLYRDGRFDTDNQHPSYQNRVDLQDKEMKDGDASLILKNVKKEDNGTYECRVFEKGKIDPISIITLEVHVSGDKDESTGDGGNKDEGEKTRIIAAVGVIFLLVVLASVGFLIYRRHMRKNPNLSVPPGEAAAEQML